MTEAQLPAEHGTELTYRCPNKQAKKGEAADTLKCQDGMISFAAGYTPCFRIGTVKSNNIWYHYFTTSVEL